MNLIREYTTEIDDNKLNKLVLVKECECGEYKLNSPWYVHTFLNETLRLGYKAEEHLYMIALDAKLNLLGVFEISHGSVCNSIISPREIFVRALLCGASNIILSHNHPSGDTTPSKEDIQVTEKIKKAGELVDIQLLEHIIVTKDKYFSFSEEKYL